MLRLRTLGSPAVEGSRGPLSGAAGQRKSLAVLALLAASGVRGLGRDRILAYLWPETDAEKGGHRLSQLLHTLRRGLQAEDLFLGSSHLRLNPEVISSDLEEFHFALEVGDCERAVSAYGGPFLDGFYLSGAPAFERWVETQRAEYANRFTAALESVASTAERGGDWVAAVGWWRRLVAEDPYNSRLAVRLMEALSASGDRAGALHFAETHETLLRQDLGVAPDQALLAAAERIRAQPAVPRSAPVPVGQEPAEGLVSVAVLPFANLSAAPEDEYFSDGLTDELIDSLARVPGLRVVSRTSAFAFKGKEVGIREVAERLKVGAVVEGSVRRAGDRVRISAQLVSAADGYVLWGETYERSLADVFAVQEELARAIVHALSAKLAEAVGAPLVRPSTEVPDAYTLYLRGRYFSSKRTTDGLRAADDYYRQAIERDPNYALAHAGLAECYAMRGFDEFGDLPASEAMPQAKAAALRALEIDPQLAEAHATLGWVTFLYDWDWAAAESEFQKAIELKPSHTLAHVWYAVFLGAMGRSEESLKWILGAEALDPVSLLVHLTVARCYCFAQRYDEAIEQLRATLEMEPTHVLTYVWLARAYGGKGLPAGALRAVERAMSFAGRLPILLSAAGGLYGLLGRHAEARGILEELRVEKGRDRAPRTYTCYEASVCAGLGDADEAFRLLDRAYEERSGYLPFLGVSWFWWNPLMSDPRFEALLKKMRLDF